MFFSLVLQCFCKGGVQFSKVYKIVIGFALVLKQYYGINDYKYCLHFDYWRNCKIQHIRGKRKQIDLCQQIVVNFNLLNYRKQLRFLFKLNTHVWKYHIYPYLCWLIFYWSKTCKFSFKSKHNLVIQYIYSLDLKMQMNK